MALSTTTSSRRTTFSLHSDNGRAAFCGSDKPNGIVSSALSLDPNRQLLYANLIEVVILQCWRVFFVEHKDGLEGGAPNRFSPDTISREEIIVCSKINFELGKHNDRVKLFKGETVRQSDMQISLVASQKPAKFSNNTILLGVVRMIPSAVHTTPHIGTSTLVEDSYWAL